MDVRLPSWPFGFHEFLTYMTIYSTSGPLGLPRYITLIDNIAHSGDVGDMTRHDLTWKCWYIHVALECMSSYNVYGWWMSSWCIIASPLHGEVCRVFDGPWFAWWSFRILFLACMLEGLTGSYVHKGTCSSCSSALHASFIHPLVKFSFYMCFFSSSHSSSCHICWCTCTYNHSWRDNIKSKTSWYTMAHDHFRCTWLGDVAKLWSGMMDLGTADENYKRVTEWWRWVIWFNSDCL